MTEVGSIFEGRTRNRADKLSSRSFAKPPKHEEGRTRKCEEPPAVNGHCFAHWRKTQEKKHAGGQQAHQARQGAYTGA